MSPRAAWRLESLGFTQVYDYVAGEANWFASGLPREGRDASIPRAADFLRRDLPTCRPTDRLGAVWARLAASGRETCVVINAAGIVLGWLRHPLLDHKEGVTVEEVMEAGPTTIRPDTRLADIVARMRERQTPSVLVTTPEGRLMGILNRLDAERALSGPSPAAEPMAP